MNNFISLYGEVLDYPQQASIDKKEQSTTSLTLRYRGKAELLTFYPLW